MYILTAVVRGERLTRYLHDADFTEACAHGQEMADVLGMQVMVNHPGRVVPLVLDYICYPADRIIGSSRNCP